MRVEIKKQYRWLIFLLVPFISLLVIHFMIPYQIINNAFPILEQFYYIKRNNFQQHSIRLIAKSSQISLAFQIQKLFHQLNTIISPSNISTKYLINNPYLKLNSAVQFNQQLTNLSLDINHQQNRSMWFVTTTSNLSELNIVQKDLFQEYTRISALIGNLIQNSMAKSIALILATNNQKVMFQYPSMYDPNIDQSSTPFIYQYFENGIRNYKASNNSFTVYQQKYLSHELFVVCKIINTLKPINGFACFSYDMPIFRDLLKQELILLSGFDTSTTYQVVRPLYQSFENDIYPRLLFSFNNSVASNLTDQPTLGFYQNLKNRREFFSTFSPTQQMVRQKLNDRLGTIYMDSISVLNNESDSNVVMYLIAQNVPQQKMLASSDIFKNNLNILTIPIVILILVSSFISILVIKKLLDSIESQMQQLHVRCQFIIEGDLQIEIPVYEGTQDIQIVYDSVRIINKLHRYSTNTYFTGHFSNKILKYNEALQIFRKLNYNTGCLLENIGECYLYIEQCQKSLKFLKESLDVILKQIEQNYGTLDQVYRKKIKKMKMPHHYKEMEVILIRRLFKILFTYWKFLDLRFTMPKRDDDFNQEEHNKLRQKYSSEVLCYIEMIKKSFYPEYSNYSEAIMVNLFAAKQHLTNNNVQLAYKCLHRFEEFSLVYFRDYEENTKKLKQKGSKNKFFHQKNKLTYHSRVNPDILRMFGKLIQGKCLLTQSKKYYEVYSQVFKLLFDGARFSVITVGLNYMIVMEIRKLLIQLKINLAKYESTQLFRQVVPFKTLYYGEITKQIEPQLLKFPTKTSPGLEREFVYLIDCGVSKNKVLHEKNESLYSKQRAVYVFEKLVKPTDRVSIIKFNTSQGVKTECNLIFKESSCEILKKEIELTFTVKQNKKSKKEELSEAIRRSIMRVRKLQSEKVLLVFLKKIEYYVEQLNRNASKRKRLTRQGLDSEQNSIKNDEEDKYEYIGDDVIQILNSEGLRNTKLIFFAAIGDSIEDCRGFFGLKNINTRIWKQNNGLNVNNNTVYLIEEKHKFDIDRILMLKTLDVPDNHVFIL